MYGPGFPDALRVATELAVLSPSSHNCQPWAHAWLTSSRARRSAATMLGGASDDEREYLALALDRRRELDALPAHAVEMRLSCGLYWEILLRGLAAQGWVLDRLRFTGTSADERALDEGWPAHWSLLSVAELRRAPQPEEGLAELRTTVEARHTNRGPYREDDIDPVVLKGLDAPATAVAAEAPVEIEHWRSEAERSRFVRFVARYGGRDFSHDAAWRETHGYLRWSASEAAARGDGFTLQHLFGPLSRPRQLFLRTALNPSLMRVLRFGGYHHVLAWQLAQITRPTPAIVAMSFRDESPDTAAMVQAGARLADYWLRATQEGLALHPISIVLQHDDVRRALQESFGLPGRTFFVSRVGHPAAEFPASPSRPVACRMV
jgi:nitroreductase